MLRTRTLTPTNVFSWCLNYFEPTFVPSFFHYFHLLFEPWHRVDPECYLIMVPIHFYIIFLLDPNNALAFFHHRFCLRVQAELVVLKSLCLDALTCTLMNDSVKGVVYAPTAISFLSIYNLHKLLFLLSVLPLMVFPSPSTKRLILTGNGFLNAALLVLAL